MRTWFKDRTLLDDGYEIFKPRKLPVSLTFPIGFCDAGSEMKLFMNASFKSPIGDISPQIVMRMNNSHELFHWDFRQGDPRAKPTPIASEYVVWSREKQTNFTATTVILGDLDQKDESFNLTITCVNFNATNQFKVALNLWDPSNGLSRTAAYWDVDATMGTTLVPDDVFEVEIIGGMDVQYVGFTQEACLALTYSGLVVEQYGNDCQTSREGICEHQSCYTKEGNECIFPFTYKEVQYTKCTSIDVYQPWCATKNDSSGLIQEWGLCLPDCQYDLPIVSCLAPPPVPKFGFRNDSKIPQNDLYDSSWFNINWYDNPDGTANHSIFHVTRSRIHRIGGQFNFLLTIE